MFGKTLNVIGTLALTLFALIGFMTITNLGGWTDGFVEGYLEEKAMIAMPIETLELLLEDTAH